MEWVSIIIGVLGVLFSWADVHFTKKTFKNTDSIKESTEKVVRQTRLYADLPDLFNKLDKCKMMVLSPDKPFVENPELITELRSVFNSLKDLIPDNEEKTERMDKLELEFANLRSAPDDRPKLASEYGVFIEDMRSLLKKGGQ